MDINCSFLNISMLWDNPSCYSCNSRKASSIPCLGVLQMYQILAKISMGSLSRCVQDLRMKIICKDYTSFDGVVAIDSLNANHIGLSSPLGPNFGDFLRLDELQSAPNGYSVEPVHWKVCLDCNGAH